MNKDRGIRRKTKLIRIMDWWMDREMVVKMKGGRAFFKAFFFQILKVFIITLSQKTLCTILWKKEQVACRTLLELCSLYILEILKTELFLVS